MTRNLPNGLITGKDGISRCWWSGDDATYIKYHDQEWGYPVNDDRQLFEKICLEGFQAGLSWLTILRKRENFRKAFDNFDFDKISIYSSEDINRLLQNKDIIRHRGKIEATINNAQRAIEIVEEFGSLARYFWQWEPLENTRPDIFSFEVLSKITQTEESKTLSKDLKKRGWRFVGPTTCYAFMQSMGIVNDHVEGCICREKVEQARASFQRP